MLFLSMFSVCIFCSVFIVLAFVVLACLVLAVVLGCRRRKRSELEGGSGAERARYFPGSQAGGVMLLRCFRFVSVFSLKCLYTYKLKQ